MGIEGMPLQIGMMMTVFLAAYGIANVVLSPLGDYLGPRKAMMLCILIWTIALMIGGVATSFALIIICRILLGIGEGFYYPLQSVFIKNWFPKQERGRANAAWIVGQSVAPAIAMPFSPVDRHPAGAPTSLCAALGLILFGYFGDMLLINQNNIKVSANKNWLISKLDRKRKAQATAKVLCCGSNR